MFEKPLEPSLKFSTAKSHVATGSAASGGLHKLHTQKLLESLKVGDFNGPRGGIDAMDDEMAKQIKRRMDGLLDMY